MAFALAFPHFVLFSWISTWLTPSASQVFAQMNLFDDVDTISLKITARPPHPTKYRTLHSTVISHSTGSLTE